MVFGNQGVPADQVQQWIAQNPQFAQAVVQSMAGQPAVRYQPMAQNNQNWMGRNALPITQTSAPMTVPNQMGMPGLHGRIIANPEEIKLNEIPMDGTASLFPMSDDSCIYAKAWGPDGKIQTFRYIREDAEPVDKGPSEFSQVMSRLDKIEQMLGQRGQQRQQKQQYYQNQNHISGQASSTRTMEGNVEAMNNG